MKTLINLSVLVLALSAFARVDSNAISLDGFYEISGTTSNYKIKNSDGWVDFSLVIPAMNAEELMNFDMAKIMSPVSDTISVLGKSFQVPSNLSLPKQTESYFLSFTLEKLKYRSYLQEVGNYNMYALQGQFPLKDAVSGFQNGKSIFEMVNLFKFYSGGAKSVEVKDAVKDVDLAIDAFKFDQQISVTAPQYKADKVMLALSLFKENNEFYPSDMKQVLSTKSAKLAARAGSENYVLSILMNNSQQRMSDHFDGDFARSISESARAGVDLNQMSYALSPASQQNPQFLNPIPAPQFNKATSMVKGVPPTAISGVVPYATVLMLTEVQTGGSESVPVDVKRVLWMTTAIGWVADITVPSEVLALIQSEKYAWELLYLGAAQGEAQPNLDWTPVTHVTRNTLKF